MGGTPQAVVKCGRLGSGERTIARTALPRSDDSIRCQIGANLVPNERHLPVSLREAPWHLMNDEVPVSIEV